ncbi:hypothetical protein [Actinomadura yumaensis]|uniref:Uncharacterized protein n=1 Tax=Actinomadura yumaensis TaxID=111807 RepID=A0ABW2CXH9_9ACTN
MATTSPAGRFRPSLAALGFAVSAAVALAFAVPAIGWWFGVGMATDEDEAPAPPDPHAVVARAAAVAVLTVGVGLVLCLRRRHPSVGAGMIAGWTVLTVASGGFLTGVAPSLYEPMTRYASWINGTAESGATPLARRMDSALVGALSQSPGAVTRVVLAHLTPRASGTPGVRVQAGATITGGGGEEAIRGPLTRRLASRYERAEPPRGGFGARFKVGADIALEIGADSDGTVKIFLTTPLLPARSTVRALPQTRDERTFGQAADLARVADVRLRMVGATAAVPCPGGGTAHVFSTDAATPLLTSVDLTKTANATVLRMHNPPSADDLAVTNGALDLHLAGETHAPITIFRRCTP